MTRGMYMCNCFVYSPHEICTHTHTHTHTRVLVVPSFGLLVFGIFPRRVQEMVERLLSLLSRQAPDSLVSTVVALCAFMFLCNCFNHSRKSFMWTFDEVFKILLLCWWLRKWLLFTALLANVKCLILGDIVPLCISKQSGVVVLSDTTI